VCGRWGVVSVVGVWMLMVGMLSHQQNRNEIMGKKQIILNPTTEQRNGTEVVTFAEGVPSPFPPFPACIPPPPLLTRL